MFLYQLTAPRASTESDVQDIAQLIRNQHGTMAVISQGMQPGVDPDTMTPGYNPYGWVKFYSTVPPPEIGDLLFGFKLAALESHRIAQIPG